MTKFEKELDKMLSNDSNNIYREDLINHFKDWQPPQENVKIPKFVEVVIDDNSSLRILFDSVWHADQLADD